MYAHIGEKFDTLASNMFHKVQHQSITQNLPLFFGIAEPIVSPC
jgi:hypothetical protein